MTALINENQRQQCTILVESVDAEKAFDNI